MKSMITYKIPLYSYHPTAQEYFTKQMVTFVNKEDVHVNNTNIYIDIKIDNDTGEVARLYGVHPKLPKIDIGDWADFCSKEDCIFGTDFKEILKESYDELGDVFDITVWGDHLWLRVWSNIRPADKIAAWFEFFDGLTNVESKQQNLLTKSKLYCIIYM